MTQPTAATDATEPFADLTKIARTNVHSNQERANPSFTTVSKLKRRGLEDLEDIAARNQQPVVIVDRNLLFRAGLTHALERSRFQVVAECSSIEKVPFDGLRADYPFLLLIGLEATRIGSIRSALLDLRQLYDELYIVIFYDHDRTSPLHPELAEIGKVVDALLPKDGIGGDSVLKALDLVLLGEVVISRELLERIATEGWNSPLESVLAAKEPDAGAEIEPLIPATPLAERHSVDSLTLRERLILSHLMKGASNKAIAREVGIAESTVKIHVRNLMLKIDAKNRTQAAMWGYKRLL